MNVTSIIETPFQVNLDSVVYAYTRGDGSSIMLSKGSVILDVAETVAELVTEAGGLLTAFTAVSGDASGDIAINPNYILTVESANGGAYSLITLCDNIYTRAKITVNTAYADMDAIVEAAAGGAAVSVVAKTANFTADGASGTIYTNDGAGDAIIATIGDVAVATEYTFIGYPTGSNFYLQPDAGITINFFNVSTNLPVSVVGGDGFAFNVTTDYGSVKMVQTDSATWVVTSSTSNMEPAEP